ncbi:MAG: hypothetical protein IMHGJWDQ_001353 [Candidatus Fervidibacter sp.]
MRNLESLNERQQQRAFERLWGRGKDAIPLFPQAFEMPRRSEQLGSWDGNLTYQLAAEGLGD